MPMSRLKVRAMQAAVMLRDRLCTMALMAGLTCSARAIAVSSSSSALTCHRDRVFQRIKAIISAPAIPGRLGRRTPGR